ncbi:MAG: hypothetical protein RLY87_628, partial [Chloroflexota bacterium]
MGFWFRWQLVVTLSMLLSACQLPTALDSFLRTVPEIPRGGTVTLAFPDTIPSVQPWHVESRAAEALVTVTQAGLMRLDAHGAPQLELLERWDASTDGLVVTATLKSNLLWSDALPLTSADVAFTYTALTSFTPKTPMLRELGVVEGVRAVDAQTVVFALKEPYAPLLTLWALPILPMHVLGDQPIESLNLVSLATGAGPFVLTERDEKGAIHLKANPHYVRGAPYLDGLVLLTNATADAMTTGLQTAQIGIAELASGATIVPSESVSVASYGQNELVAVLLNARDGHATSDGALRTILRRSLPISTTLQSAAIPEYEIATSHVLDQHPFAVTTPLTTVVDIQPFMIDAGWVWDASTRTFLRDDKPLSLRIGVDNTNPDFVRIAEAIATQWRERGLTVVVDALPRDAFLGQFIPPFAYDVAIVAWGNGRSDGSYADTFLYDGTTYPLFAKELVNPGMPDVRATLNLTGYADDIYEARIVSAQRTYDLAIRATDERAALSRADAAHV